MYAKNCLSSCCPREGWPATIIYSSISCAFYGDEQTIGALLHFAIFTHFLPSHYSCKVINPLNIQLHFALPRKKKFTTLARSSSFAFHIEKPTSAS